MPHHPALRRYQQAIRALSDDRYGTFTDRERQAVIRVLRREKRRLLHDVFADEKSRKPNHVRLKARSSSVSK